MKDFFITLYSNENFPIYLGLFIVALVIAFVVVYYWGKKDQKLIETRRLEKINIDNSKDAFKETGTKEKVEVKAKDYEEEKIELPKKIEMPLPKDVPNVKTPERRIDPSFEYTKTIELPKLDEKSGVKTISIEDFNLLADSIDEELKSLEKMQGKGNSFPEEDIDYLYEDTKEIELPKLKR